MNYPGQSNLKKHSSVSDLLLPLSQRYAAILPGYPVRNSNAEQKQLFEKKSTETNNKIGWIK